MLRLHPEVFAEHFTKLWDDTSSWWKELALCSHLREGSVEPAEVFTSEGCSECNVLRRGKKPPGV